MKRLISLNVLVTLLLLLSFCVAPLGDVEPKSEQLLHLPAVLDLNSRLARTPS